MSREAVKGPDMDDAGAVPQARACHNCGAPLGGRFCAQCGQEHVALDVPLRRVVGEVFAELFDVDSRVWRTLRALLLRPGLLTAEYNAGRRARYLPPLRVYMLSSLIFFFVVATAPVTLVQVGVTEDELEAVEQDVATAAGPGDTASAAGSRAELPVRLGRAMQDPERFNRLWLRMWAWTMFALLPVFALLMQTFFRRAAPWYVRSLVFSLHIHAFAFLILALPIALSHLLEERQRAPVALAAFGIIALQFVLATRRAYGLPWPGTLLRLAGAGMTYAFVAAVFMAASVLAVIWFA